MKALVNNLRDAELRAHLGLEFHRQLSSALDERRRKAQNAKGQEQDLRARVKQLDTEMAHITDAISKVGLDMFRAKLDSILSEKQVVEDLLTGLSDQVYELPSLEEIDSFLAREVDALADTLVGDRLRARQEIRKRVDKLRLKPIPTPDGMTFEVTGDIRLFSPADVSLQGTSGSTSSQHYTCAVPFSTTLYQNAAWHAARGRRRQTWGTEDGRFRSKYVASR